MKINSILDVTPEMAADIQYLWDESNLTSEEIASDMTTTLLMKHGGSDWDWGFPPEVVWDILGGAYVYEDNQN